MATSSERPSIAANNAQALENCQLPPWALVNRPNRMGKKRSKRQRESQGGVDDGEEKRAEDEMADEAEQAAKKRGVVSAETVVQWRPKSVAGGIRYLEDWAAKAEGWKFKKTRQTFLLQHMYDPLTLDKELFKVMLRYLEGLRGQARKEALSRAERLRSASETASPDEDSSNEARDLLLETHARRAGKQHVAQLAADELAEARAFAEKALPILRHRSKKVARTLAKPPTGTAS